jgi:hypothetical protein
MPSDYYNYEYVSPDPLFAEVKEEMRSYFDTGVVDDTMFPLYTEKTLRKLGRIAYKIDEALLEVRNTCARLPEDFKFVREVWACRDICYSITAPSAVYTQQTCIVGNDGPADVCNQCPPPACDRTFKVYLKTTGQEVVSFRRSHLLRPGSRHAANLCSPGSPNLHTVHPDTFEVRDCKINTCFESGLLHLVYYKEQRDENQFQLIPDNYAIGEYIKAFIKYKLYEQIYNSVSDETFNQVERKYQTYYQQYLDAYILADAEVKKQTVYQKVNAINRQRRLMARYYIP